MPYNNTPIAPSSEPTGMVSLPLARVKKIITADEDIGICSNNAAFVITIATEMFIQHLVEKTHEIIRAEKKPRRNVQYQDVANAVARLDNLEFLSDVVPRTTTYKKVMDDRKRKEAVSKQKKPLTNGQTRLDLAGPSSEPLAGPSNSATLRTSILNDTSTEDANDTMQIDERDPSAMQLDMEASQASMGVNGGH